MTGKRRKSIVMTKDGVETEYESQSAAARALGISQSPISEMCLGFKKTYHGYTARFKDAQHVQSRQIARGCEVGVVAESAAKPSGPTSNV